MITDPTSHPSRRCSRWFVSVRTPVLALALLASLQSAACDAESDAPATASGGATAPAAGSANGGTTAAGAGAPASGGSVVSPASGSAGLGASGAPSAGGSSGTASGGAASAAGGSTAGSGGGAMTSGGTSTGGAGGSGGNVSTAGSGGKTGTGKHPFPENQRLPGCTYPTNVNPEHARTAYQRWKSEIVTAEGARGYLRTRRPNSPGAETNSTVSEGIAYGMIIAVAMGDQPLFDNLWNYSQQFLNENGLMHWYINAAGTAPISTGGATDSDEDIAWALVMADRQWGGSGTLDKPYLELAKEQIQRIWDHEIDHQNGDLVLPGDSWNEAIFNPSYFAPNQYRIFGQVTGKVDDWKRVIDTGYATLAKCLNEQSGNADNGLAPAWCNLDGEPTGTNDAWNYQYDSARVPFRIGQDYCYSGEPRAKAYLEKVSAFFAGIGAANIVDGYALDGTPEPDPNTTAGLQSAVFVGSAAVGAMHDAKYQTFIDEAYARVATGELLARSIYYNHSWTTLSLLMLSGNLIEYTP
jgi:endo-1,4-beta-D-glucanase Y